MIRAFIIGLSLITLCSCSGRGYLQNFLFDMGTDTVPCPKGFVRVNATQEYDSAKGYGWLRAGNSDFSKYNKKLHIQALCSGVLGKGSLLFRVDVPNGEYALIITVGNTDSIPMKMLLSVNGTPIADSIEAPWYRLAYRTKSFRHNVTNGRIELGIKGIGTDLGIYSVEIRPTVNWTGMGQGIEEDTLVVINYRQELQNKIKRDSSDLNS